MRNTELDGWPGSLGADDGMIPVQACLDKRLVGSSYQNQNSFQALKIMLTVTAGNAMIKLG